MTDVNPREWATYLNDDGEKYYYNLVTGQTEWLMPFDEADLIFTHGAGTPLRGRTVGSGGDFAASNVSHAFVSVGEVSNWEAYVDAQGNEYYYNPDTNMTTWTNPNNIDQMIINAQDNTAATSITNSLPSILQQPPYSKLTPTIELPEYEKKQPFKESANSEPRRDAPRGLDEILIETKDNVSVVSSTLNGRSLDPRSTMLHDIMEPPVTSPKRIDFIHDEQSEMTNIRRVALSLINKKWYYPIAQEEEQKGSEQRSGVGKDAVEEEEEDDEQTKYAKKKGFYRTENGYPTGKCVLERPNLEKAWGYFEHVILQRHKKVPSEKYTGTRNIWSSSVLLEHAESGENEIPTSLYSPYFTPHSQLGDFGLGIGLYFTQLKALAILTFLCGLINIPNFLYFNSETYSDGKKDSDMSITQKLSAVCTNEKWVPCPDCQDMTMFSDRFGEFRNGNDPVIKFVLKNMCDGARLNQVLGSLFSLLFVVIGIFALNKYNNVMEIAFDEDQQTAQDYSISVSNPPSDANDPEEWHQFFKQNFRGAHVAALTIGVGNDLLINYLVERRETMRKIEMMVEPGTKLDAITLAYVSAKTERARGALQRTLSLFSPGLPELVAKLDVLTSKIQGLAQLDYPVTNIFVTFGSEKDQRYVLEKLVVGKYQSLSNNSSALSDEKFLFRSKHVLQIEEPDEPNTIRWQDLNEGLQAKMMQLFYTTVATIIAILSVAFMVNFVNGIKPLVASYVVAAFNAAFPQFAKVLTNFEKHTSEGSKQTSLFFKIALFRWVNTAIVFVIIVPFTDTVTGKLNLIHRVETQFIAEIVTATVLQYLDFGGFFKRHYLAPRATTQDAMNLSMQGTEVELAERYTNMTKIFFLALWYSSIYPCGFFMCSIALLVNYYIDRWSVMRTWKQMPNLGTRISKCSRTYFVPLAIVAMAISSSYYWAGFPFDNVCEMPGTKFTDLLDTLPEKGRQFYNDTSQITELPVNIGTGVVIVPIEITSAYYGKCDSSLMQLHKFPAISKWAKEADLNWMTEGQEQATNISGYASVVVMILVSISFLWQLKNAISDFFHSSYESRGEDQGIDFCDAPSISSYVPQIQSDVFSYPLLAASVDGISEDLFDWNDPDKPRAYYDLTKDADALVHDINKGKKKINFSIIAHWEKSVNGNASKRFVNSFAKRTTNNSNQS